MVVDRQGLLPHPRLISGFGLKTAARTPLVRAYLLLIDRDEPLSSLCRRC